MEEQRLIDWIGAVVDCEHFTNEYKIETIEDFLLNYYKQQNEGKWTQLQQ